MRKEKGDFAGTTGTTGMGSVAWVLVSGHADLVVGVGLNGDNDNAGECRCVWEGHTEDVRVLEQHVRER